ncbi:MAG TPA: hypothetical protein VG815_19560 [Chloroflexota bacterium]|nr:hypothetical protein [Chloroflexota bacterium]
MTVVSRRLVPFAAVLAVAVTVSVWVTASAAVQTFSTPAVLAPMHFKTVQTSKHVSLNGATDQNLTGATLQQTANLLASGRPVGHAFIACTLFNNKSLVGICTIELRLTHRGRLELQGSVMGNSKTFAITGGTGAFTMARGWVIVDNHDVTITFR